MLLGIAQGIERALGRLAAWSGWLLLALMAITVFDVLCRKLLIPLPYTKMQEMEWHLHTAIFSFWIGFNYTINAHPRVDSYIANLSLRKRAWIELAGCLLLAAPYMIAVAYYGFELVAQSWLTNEHSEAPNGLPNRWIIKSVLYAGVILVLLAILSVVLKLVAVLFGGVHPDRVGLRVGPSASEV